MEGVVGIHLVDSLKQKSVDKKKSLLWISASVPYDNVSHASGKIHNFYLKYLKANGDYHIVLLSFFRKNEQNKIDLDRYGIEHELIERRIWRFPDIIFNTESVLNPWNRYAGIDQNYTVIELKRRLKKLKERNIKPDVIILEWTEMVVLIDVVKKYFSDAKYIGIEEDVKFLAFERRYNSENNILKKIIYNTRYKKLHTIELLACNKCDKVIVNNPKDRILLKDNGINNTKIFEWTPYFDCFLDVPYEGDKKQIIFYGAMNRAENIEAAEILVNDILPLLRNQEVEVLIIGANPTVRVRELESDRVRVLGFVENVGEFFKHAMCFAAPLRHGAGVKIKIIEALSAGIPVITTDVGIEGISAKKNEEYIHCDEIEDFALNIDVQLLDRDKRLYFSNNEKNFIRNTYSINKSAREFDLLIGRLA